MRETKLISVRLDKEDIKDIDQWCKSDGFWKRSAVISQAVALARVLVQSGHAKKLLHFNPRYGDVIDDFKLTYHRKVD